MRITLDSNRSAKSAQRKSTARDAVKSLHGGNGKGAAGGLSDVVPLDTIRQLVIICDNTAEQIDPITVYPITAYDLED